MHTSYRERLRVYCTVLYLRDCSRTTASSARSSLPLKTTIIIHVLYTLSYTPLYMYYVLQTPLYMCYACVIHPIINVFYTPLYTPLYMHYTINIHPIIHLLYAPLYMSCTPRYTLVIYPTMHLLYTPLYTPLYMCYVLCVCFLPIHSGHQVRWTYQPGSHRRKVTHDFLSTSFLRCVPLFFSREGFSHSFPSSTVKSNFVY